MRGIAPRTITRLRWFAIVLVVATLGCAGDVPADEDRAVGPDAGGTVEVEVFFANERLGDPCGEVFPVVRMVDAADPVRGALEALLAGPSVAEQQEGYGGWFSVDTEGMLLDVTVVDGVAEVVFADLRSVIPNASSSCGSAGLLAQLDRTLLAFDEVGAARYALADEAAFYTWLQLGVPDGVGPPDEEPAAALTAERIAAELAAVIERSEGLTEASVICDHTGPVQPGDISVCMYISEPESVEGNGPMFAVLDASRVAWLPWWSSYPTSTARVRVLHHYAPSGLHCRDLLSGAAPYPFDVSGVRPEEAVFWSIVYWNLEGQPARMDVDGNGIPCESLYDAEVVASVVHEVAS